MRITYHHGYSGGTKDKICYATGGDFTANLPIVFLFLLLPLLTHLGIAGIVKM